MNNIFNNKALIGFIMAGDPDLETTKQNILAMEKAGLDIVELGIPFSDPIAESDLIQDSNLRALNNNTYLPNIFKMIEELRKESQIPVIFHTYMNPVFNYGYENFFNDCQKNGVKGIIIPDLPYEEKSEISEFAKKYDVSIISFIVPSDENRIKKIAKDAQGFIYFVPSIASTAKLHESLQELKNNIETIKSSASIPVALGCGIETVEQAKQFSQIADGIILGGKIVEIIEQHGKNSPDYIYNYVKEMKAAVSL